MADKKISELPSASALTGTEIVPLVQGGTTDKTTTQDIADLAINSLDLQSITSNGNTTVDDLIVQGGDYISTVKKEYIESKNIITNKSAVLRSDAKLQLQNNFVTGLLGVSNLTNSIQLEFPDKTAGNYTIATTDDLSGLVPYTGATSDVDLDTHILNAQSLNVKGTGGNGYLGLKHQSADATATGSETVIFAGSDGEPRYKNASGTVAQFASRAWVTAQGYITNVITALGYTPVPTTRTINGYDLSANRTLNASDVSAVASNSAITGATKTKITYDSKGLVTSGADATTADIADSTNKRYVTDAQLTVIGNTSNTNTGDETATTIRTKLGITTLSGSNTGDETQATILSKLGFYRYLNVMPSTTHTGTTLETQIEMITIPANTFNNTSDVFDFLVQARRPSGSGAGTFTFRFRLGTTNVMSSATSLAQSIPASTAVYAPMSRAGSINSGTLLIFSRASNLVNDLTATAASPATTTSLSFDFTTTLYAFVSIELSNSADSVQVSRVQIKNF